MTPWTLLETPDGIRIEHTGVFLGFLKRADLTIRDGRFDKGESPVFNWQPRFTVVLNSPYEPAWNFPGADLSARAVDDARAELTGSFQSRDGRLAGRFTVAITVAETGRIAYHARQVLDILADYPLSDHIQLDENVGAFTRPGQPAAFLEYTDPIFLQGIGPATPFTRDWPEMIWPLPLFRKGLRKWWQMTAYRHESGGVAGRFHNHFVPTDLMPIHRDEGWIGFFLEKEKLNPVVVPDPANERPSYGALCPWAYDLHVGYMIPAENGRCVLRAGERFEAAYRFLALDGPKAAELLDGLKMDPLTPVEWRLLDRPAYRAGVNDFREQIEPLDESLPWVAGPGATWDKAVGRGDNNSLRLDSHGSTPAQWSVQVGRDRFMDPLVEGAAYELRAWVETENAAGPGVRLGLGHAVAKSPGVTGESLPIEHRWSAPVTGTNEWTQVIIPGLPVPKDTMWTGLYLVLDGPGRAWFDDVELAPVSAPR